MTEQKDVTDFTPDELALIDKIDGLFPDKKIRAQFDRYRAVNNETCDPDSTFPDYMRLEMAWEDARRVMRAGYVRRGVPKDAQQTLENHGRYVGRLAQVFKPASLKFRCPDEAQTEGEIHDLPEVIAGDFTPHDMNKITKDEKFRLEELAARLVFPKHLYNLWIKHETGNAPEQTWVRDCDLLEMPLHIVSVIEPRYPDMEEKLQCIFEDVAGRIQTERGQDVFERLLESRDHRRKKGYTLGHAYHAGRPAEQPKSVHYSLSTLKGAELARMVYVMGLVPR